ncbi:hypothetical protein IGI04_026346 [Brassica rapa subsp. trilocularis]|uniref:Uncharacterized protein n=1 Tax=Brassica rapa subsp. trilocularis TaxID=1813537 RepID=A0ABQ7KVR6_BRACM|nr:hypothetical protein IGI04_026346 [Brassica rapa subsp. trilocularis]
MQNLLIAANHCLLYLARKKRETSYTSRQANQHAKMIEKTISNKFYLLVTMRRNGYWG